MKITFQFSILFNMLLAGGLAFVILDRPRMAKVPAPIPLEAQPPASPATAPLSPAVSAAQPAKFCWSQLDSRNDYRAFIANLHAIGCPENTIEDIVRGNVGRAFAWQRAQLRIDGSGNGLWSRSSELELTASLLGNPVAMEMASPRSAGGQTQGGISGVAAGGNTEDAISQNGYQMAGTVGSSQYGQAGYPFYPGGNQQPGNLSGGQGSSGVNEPLRNTDGLEPQTGASASFNPGDSPNPGATPGAETSDDSSAADSSDPLGPNDPYARSAQDIQIADLNNYYDWFASQTAANVSGQDMGIDPTSYLP